VDVNGLEEKPAYAWSWGNYDIVQPIHTVDTGNKAADIALSCLASCYNFITVPINYASNLAGNISELADKACEVTIGCSIDEATMTMMANGLLAPAGAMLNGFNTYMNGLKLANTSKIASTAISVGQTAVNVGASLFNVDPIPTSATKFYVAPNGDCLPAVGYRYMDSRFYEKTLETMTVPGSYFGFERFDSANQAINAFQINPTAWKNNCQLRGQFDTLQVFDGCFIPKSFGNTGEFLEPYTCCYPMLGTGGYQQYIYTGTITLDDVKLLEK
ncbi:MAG: hypothetical protein HUJ68_12790, partial [Clostridia bacterium]|nr:hypothetical protein [Clostridia bacterium]